MKRNYKKRVRAVKLLPMFLIVTKGLIQWNSKDIKKEVENV